LSEWLDVSASLKDVFNIGQLFPSFFIPWIQRESTRPRAASIIAALDAANKLSA
jgi:hypothetical protein